MNYDLHPFISNDSNKLIKALHDFLLQYGVARTYWIAYSGGLDSHVLLSLLNHLRQVLPLSLRAIHINHHISPHAKRWVSHCATVCKQYQIDFHACHIHLENKLAGNIEEIAREKRYAMLADYLTPNDILLTGHHQDDQAETFLLQLMRGAGLKGLSAMPAIKAFARGLHGRPLLAFSREQLLNYANEQHLTWIEDESNQDTLFTRNFIRHHILSLLKSRWPTASAIISRSATHCAEAQVLLEEIASEEYKKVRGQFTNTISISKLLQLPCIRQRIVLRTWITQLGFPLPDSKKIQTIQTTLLTAANDRMPSISWKNTTIRRYRDELYIMQPFAAHHPLQSFVWGIDKTLSLPGIGILRTRQKIGTGLRNEIFSVTVRFRQGGEVIRIGRKRRTLKNLFQEWRIPYWERDRIPLLYIDQKLIGVVGYMLDSAYLAKAEEVGREVILEREDKCQSMLA